MAEPNIDFGSPAIFFDSHPEEQESYLYSYWSSLKATLKIAYTGHVPKPLSPGTLRIIWYTYDGNEGMKDYELHEYALVRENFDVLLKLDEVRRVVIMGFSGQNPYLMGPNPWRDKIDREYRKLGRETRRARLEQKKMEGTGLSREEREKMEAEKKQRLQGQSMGELVDIEGVIEEHDRAEEEKMRLKREQHWKESDGLLTGEMV